MAKKFSEATAKAVADFADPATAYLMGVDMDASPDAFKMVRSEVQKLVTPSATWTTNGVTLAPAAALTGSSSPSLTVTQTWNNGSTTFTGALINITDTASNAASKLLDLQVGGSSKASIAKDGSLSLGDANLGGLGTVLTLTSSLGTGIIRVGGGGALICTELFYSQKGLNVSADTGFITLGTSGDVALQRDAADILAQRRSTNGNTFKVYRTFTSSSTFERATFGWHDSSSDTGVVGTTLRIGTEKGSVGGTARAVAVITDGTARVTYGASGGQTMAEGHNTTLGTTTGSKIGTATNEKLGFWNATPVVQQVLATGAGATVDNVITLLQTLGLCKQS